MLDGGNPLAAFTCSVAHSGLPTQGQSREACMGLAQIEHTSCTEEVVETLFMHNNWSNFLVKASTLLERPTKYETS